MKSLRLFRIIVFPNRGLDMHVAYEAKSRCSILFFFVYFSLLTLIKVVSHCVIDVWEVCGASPRPKSEKKTKLATEILKFM